MLQQWLRQRLGIRLAAVCFTLSILIALVVTTLQVYGLKKQSIEQTEQLFIEIEKSFVPTLSDAMWTLDPARIKAQLDALSHLPTVALLELTDDAGNKTQQKIRNIDSVMAQRLFDLVYTVDGQSIDVGKLNIVLDRTALDKRISDLWKISLFTSFAVTLASCFLLIWLFHHWVVVHLQQVSEYASQLNAQNLSKPLILTSPSSPDDEIGKIVIALTEMQQQLLKEFERRSLVEGELKNYQSHLEEMVNERTLRLEERTTELESQSKILTEQNLELNAFAHTVAHDLKHPLTSLIGLSTLLNKAFETLGKEQQQEFLQQMLQSSLKMNSMINSLLQLASLRSDVLPEKSEVSMIETVHEALKSLSTLVKDNNPILEIAPDMPQLNSHQQWIEQIWLNYISNAIKYGGKPAQISVGFEKQEQLNQYVFWIDDNGPGIPADKAGMLFTEFNRLHTIRADSHGLGLSIVRRICTKLGGKCGYELNASGGSRFWFSLPA